tara:strand:+ start:160 stop:732 length:573 start_codon:yes stop_codon:yes gene_type:complete
MGTKKAFKPLLVWYNENAHIGAENQAKVKLNLLDEASVWIHNQIELDDSKINMKRLHLNMVEYFKDVVLNHFKDVNQLGLSAGKLIEAKEIPIKQLVDIQKAYEQVAGDVTFPDNIPCIEVLKSDYEMWTRTEQQNQKVIYGNQFIKSVRDLERLNVKVYPANIAQATSGFIKYDLHKNEYHIDRQEIYT